LATVNFGRYIVRYKPYSLEQYRQVSLTEIVYQINLDYKAAQVFFVAKLKPVKVKPRLSVAG
jgi:hypothetical protein